MKKVLAYITVALTLYSTPIMATNSASCIQLLDETIINLKSNNETVFGIKGCSEEQINKDLANYLVETDSTLTLVQFEREVSNFTEVIEELKKTIPDSDTYTELRPITEFWSGSFEVKPNERVDKGYFINNDGKKVNENFLAFFYTKNLNKIIMISKFVDEL